MSTPAIRMSSKTLAIGDSAFIRKVVVPACEQIESVCATHSMLDSDESLNLEGEHAYAHLTGLDALVGFMLFVTSWTTTKALESFFGRELSGVFDSIKENWEGLGRTRRYAIALAIENVPARITIVMVCIGRDAKEMQRSQQLIPEVLRRAVAHAQTDASGRLHVYRIEQGLSNILPEVANSWDEVLYRLGNMSIGDSPHLVRDEGS